MTKRIFQSIFIVALAVLVASLVFIMGMLYEYFFDQYKTQLKNEAIYVAQGIEMEGLTYLQELQEHGTGNRITWIDENGTVLYDTWADVATMENHLDREEVKEAIADGTGESHRYSDTLAQTTVYYAVKLTDNTILRVSTNQSSVWVLLIGVLQPVSIVLILALVLSGVLAGRVAKQVVKPLNNIDLEHPEEVETYEELTPMLRRIAKQNQQIRTQMAELERRQQEFTTITENMSEGLLVVDHHTEVLSYNASAKRLLGIDKVEEGQSVLTLNRSANFRKTLDLALAGQHNEQTMSLDGRLYQLIANPVYDEAAVIGAVILILDVTEREEREQLRREFTANVSHELKTPLTSISGFAEIIQNGIAKPEDVGRFAGNIYEESQRLITLLGDIIRLSQLDENTAPVEQEEVELLGVVDAVMERLQPLAEKRNIHFSLRGERATIKGVSHILDEMIFNLCDNAIKYNREGGSIDLRLEQTEQQVIFSVKDTGIGIPAGEQARVFERFYRVDKSHSKEIGGTGLGLSIVKHGAMYHNATVSLQSELGVGTTVTIIFPKSY